MISASGVDNRPKPKAKANGKRPGSVDGAPQAKQQKVKKMGSPSAASSVASGGDQEHAKDEQGDDEAKSAVEDVNGDKGQDMVRQANDKAQDADAPDIEPIVSESASSSSGPASGSAFGHAAAFAFGDSSESSSSSSRKASAPASGETAVPASGDAAIEDAKAPDNAELPEDEEAEIHDQMHESKQESGDAAMPDQIHQSKQESGRAPIQHADAPGASASTTGDASVPCKDKAQDKAQDANAPDIEPLCPEASESASVSAPGDTPVEDAKAPGNAELPDFEDAAMPSPSKNQASPSKNQAELGGDTAVEDAKAPNDAAMLDQIHQSKNQADVSGYVEGAVAPGASASATGDALSPELGKAAQSVFENASLYKYQ